MAQHGHGPDPSKIMQIGTGFFATKTLLSAVELGLFTRLAASGKTGAAIQKELELHPRATADFLDALVSLGFLKREGASVTGVYTNAEDSDLFLDKNKPTYMGGILEMANHRLYGFWGHLTEALRTGAPQNEAKQGGDLFQALYADERRLEEFLRAMSGVQMGAFLTLAQKFDFSPYKTVCDVGGAGGALSMALARAHAHLSLTSFDLPPVAPIATRNVQAAGLAERVAIAAGDFFAGPLPKADVVVMGNILHDWNEEKKQKLVQAAWDALPPGGAFIAVENVIDDDRKLNAFGLLMSLNMLIETGDGFDYTGADFARWTKAAGFKRISVVPLVGPTSAAIAYK
ncbi:MAG TPA: methyltransferase [Polyangiaceae bacterium]|nr:methyltransferase [Polyangiaceae bacterium]